jgi:hypothetical protein
MTDGRRAMAEMSLERACEVLNECEYDNATDWEPGVAGEPGDMRWVISRTLRKRMEASGAIDEAERLAATWDGTLPVAWTRNPKVVEAMRDVHPRPKTEDAAPPAERAGEEEERRDAMMDRVVTRLTSYAKGYMAAQDAARRKAERAGGRPEAWQLSGDSGQLGEAVKDAADAIRGLSSDARASHVNLETFDKDGFIVGSWGVPMSSLRALLAVAERGRPASDLRSQVLALAELKPGWYDGEGEAFDAGQLAAVADVLDRLVGLAGANAYPMPNGRISVEWHSGPRSDSLEIDPHTLAMRMHLYDLDSGETIVGEIAPESLLAVAERGAGAEAGPAVRELMEGIVAFKALGMSPDITTAFLAVIPIDRLFAALAELDMEPPR